MPDREYVSEYRWTPRAAAPRRHGTYLIACIIGTRPEAIKMAPVIKALRAHGDTLDTRVILTGQHPQAAELLEKDFGIMPNEEMEIFVEAQSLDQLTGKLFFAADALRRHGLANRLFPSMVLVQGDTTTALGVALSCFYNKIPIGHVEAGLRTNDRYNPWPEEMNRRMIGDMADLHFAPTRVARDALLREAVRPWRVVLTGNPVVDALEHVMAQRADFTGSPLEGLPLDDGRLLVATLHRRESWGEGIDGLARGLRSLVEPHDDLRLVMPVHLNPAIANAVKSRLDGHDRIHLVPPLRYGLFVHLLAKAHLIVTDSGGIQEEAPSLNKPVLVVREQTERVEATATSQIRLIGRNPQRLTDAASALLSDPAAYAAMLGEGNPFGDGHAGKRIALAVKRFFTQAEPFLGAEEEFDPDRVVPVAVS